MTINYRRTARLRLGLWLFVTTLFFAAPVEAKVTRYVTGNAGDVAPTLAPARRTTSAAAERTLTRRFSG